MNKSCFDDSVGLQVIRLGPCTKFILSQDNKENLLSFTFYDSDQILQKLFPTISSAIHVAGCHHGGSGGARGWLGVVSPSLRDPTAASTQVSASTTSDCENEAEIALLDTVTPEKTWRFQHRGRLDHWKIYPLL